MYKELVTIDYILPIPKKLLMPIPMSINRHIPCKKHTRLILTVKLIPLILPTLLVI